MAGAVGGQPVSPGIRGRMKLIVEKQKRKRAESFAGGQSCSDQEVDTWSKYGDKGTGWQTGGGRRVVRKSEPMAG